MRIRILSDLHVELSDWSPPPAPADVVVLAGDIGDGPEAVDWALWNFPDVPVVQIAGNHEGYGRTWDAMIDQCRDRAAGTNIAFLENQAVEIEGVRFLGAVFWSDFALFGADAAPGLMDVAQRRINDYARISTASGAPLRPTDTLEMHRESAGWLRDRFDEPWDGPTVVVTHFPVHGHSAHGLYLGDPLSAYFGSHLEELILSGRPELWIHGHTHWNCDYRVGGTRMVSNQRGYVGEADNPAQPFDPSFTVALD